MPNYNKQGITFIELIVTLAIIGILSSLSFIAFSQIRNKARDTKRKADLSMIGRFLTFSCYMPSTGPGTYDITDIINVLASSEEKFKQLTITNFRDPSSGSKEKSNYFYIVNDNNKCALFANLENTSEPITLKNITSPTAGGGTGVFASSTLGVNGSLNYYQVSN